MEENQLKIKLEERNRFLEAETKRLGEEQYKCSRRASEIQFIKIGIKGEIEANRQIIEEIKKGQNEDK